MLRKVIQLGDGMLVVSLPSAWARQHGLKKGDELEAEEQGPRLVVYPKAEAKASKASIDISNTEPVTGRILGALYKAGYDEMELTFGSQKELDLVQNMTRNSFVGFEVVDTTKHSVFVKNISRSNYGEFDTLMRRIFLSILEMGSSSYKAIASGDSAALAGLESIDNDVNRHVNFCRRVLNTSGHLVVSRIAPTYHMVEQLERAGDYYKYLGAYLSKSGVVAKSALKEFLADTNAFVRMFYELYYNFSLQRMAEFWKEKERLEKSLKDAIGAAGRNEIYALLMVSEILHNVAGANGALLTARL